LVEKVEDIFELGGSLKKYTKGKKYPTKKQITDLWVEEYQK
jgi:hypothetical protein